MDEVIDSTEATESAVVSEAPAAVGSQAENATITLLRGGAETESVFDLHGVSVIGRFDPSHGPIDIDLGGLEEGSYVSRKHASIEKEENGWTIKDLGSSNGTWIKEGTDFNRVESGVLSEGTIFSLGNAQFVFHEGHDAVSEAEPPPEQSEDPQL